MNLISYREASDIAATSARTRVIARTTTMRTEEAHGYVVATSVAAVEPYPLFDNSAVDGYALGDGSDLSAGSRLKLIGEIAAGGEYSKPLSPGTAIRIFTGAPVPVGSSAVAMQEDVGLDGEFILLRADAHPGDHIRRAATDVSSGDVLLEEGTVVNSGCIALLLSQGIVKLLVRDKPKVSIVVTGSELVPPDATPEGGQIRETNGAMLAALSRRAGAVVSEAVSVQDDERSTREAIQRAASQSDIVVVSGGASVGDYDYVARVISDLGTIRFHGVKMRPGKPILFGEIGECLVFGLPGNPASVFVGFALFVKPAIRLIAGCREEHDIWLRAESGFEHKAEWRDDFVRVKLTPGARLPIAEMPSVQGSFGLRSLAQADALAWVPAEQTVRVGDEVPILILDQ